MFVKSFVCLKLFGSYAILFDIVCAESVSVRYLNSCVGDVACCAYLNGLFKMILMVLLACERSACH